MTNTPSLLKIPSVCLSVCIPLALSLLFVACHQEAEEEDLAAEPVREPIELEAESGEAPSDEERALQESPTKSVTGNMGSQNAQPSPPPDEAEEHEEARTPSPEPTNESPRASEDLTPSIGRRPAIPSPPRSATSEDVDGHPTELQNPRALRTLLNNHLELCRNIRRQIQNGSTMDDERVRLEADLRQCETNVSRLRHQLRAVSSH